MQEELENSQLSRMLSFNKDSLEEKELPISDVTLDKLAADKVNWLSITDFSDNGAIKELCSRLGLHHLVAESITDTGHMARLDFYDDHLLIVLKLIDYNASGNQLITSHVGIVLKRDSVISFYEDENCRAVFEPVAEKIRQQSDRTRRSGPDYLCYELFSCVVDHYFSIIDEIGDVADDIEEELISKPERSTLQKIYFVKRKLMVLRKSVFPLRELIGDLFNSDSELISQEIKLYYHDIYDHLIQTVDSIETYQDILSNMLDIYLSSVSNKTNDIMKVLTIFSAIFIPLTFLAGIYGMNFENIPLLHQPYGYSVFWLLSLGIAAAMLLYFHRKKWL